MMTSWRIEQRTFLFSRLMLALMAVIATFSLTACSLKNSTQLLSSSVTASLAAEFQQYGNVSARFFGLVTFEGYGTMLTYPAEFAIPPISI